jgi:hypothetical protein
VIRGAVEPFEVGLLRHHGPELFPVFELIAGGGLPVAAALVLARLRSMGARLGGGSADPADPPAPAEETVGPRFLGSPGSAPGGVPAGDRRRPLKVPMI